MGAHVSVSLKQRKCPIFQREKYHQKIAVGGDYFLKPRKSNQKRLVLVAGGVGINPILSMVRQLASNNDGWKDIILIYSARNWEDILYKDEVLSLMKFLPQLRIRIYLTQVTSGEMPSSNLDQVQFHSGRLAKENLYFNEFSPDECVAYLCGPPQMSENVSDWLNGRISEINFEKWW